MYSFVTMKIKGKLVVVRQWNNSWFPVTPVKGVDYVGTKK